MKKNVKAAVLLVLFFCVHHYVQAQIEITIRAGGNLTSANLKDASGAKLKDVKFKTGVHAGIQVDVPFVKKLFIQPGLVFSQKGYQYGARGQGLSSDFKISPAYVELPVNLVYKSEMNKGKFFAGAGPYIAYGIGGKWSSESTVGTSEMTSSGNGKVEFVKDLGKAHGGNKMVYGKPIDFGANALVGYQFENRVLIQLNGQLGLINNQPKLDGAKPEGSIKNMGLGISLGYRL